MEFYLLVAGSRGFNSYNEFCNCIDIVLKKQIAYGNDIIIVSGGARGADKMAEQYAKEHNYRCEVFPAEWNKYGKKAGFIRNSEMQAFISNPSDKKRGCICFWDLQSPGTKQNFKLAKTFNTQLRVYDFIHHRFLTEAEVQSYA